MKQAKKLRSRVRTEAESGATMGLVPLGAKAEPTRATQRAVNQAVEKGLLLAAPRDLLLVAPRALLGLLVALMGTAVTNEMTGTLGLIFVCGHSNQCRQAGGG